MSVYLPKFSRDMERSSEESRPFAENTMRQGVQLKVAISRSGMNDNGIRFQVSEGTHYCHVGKKKSDDKPHISIRTPIPGAAAAPSACDMCALSTWVLNPAAYLAQRRQLSSGRYDMGT